MLLLLLLLLLGRREPASGRPWCDADARGGARDVGKERKGGGGTWEHGQEEAKGDGEERGPWSSWWWWPPHLCVPVWVG